MRGPSDMSQEAQSCWVRDANPNIKAGRHNDKGSLVPLTIPVLQVTSRFHSLHVEYCLLGLPTVAQVLHSLTGPSMVSSGLRLYAWPALLLCILQAFEGPL
jgi:hypothetical protein